MKTSHLTSDKPRFIRQEIYKKEGVIPTRTDVPSLYDSFQDAIGFLSQRMHLFSSSVYEQVGEFNLRHNLSPDEWVGKFFIMTFKHLKPLFEDMNEYFRTELQDYENPLINPNYKYTATGSVFIEEMVKGFKSVFGIDVLSDVPPKSPAESKQAADLAMFRHTKNNSLSIFRGVNGQKIILDLSVAAVAAERTATKLFGSVKREPVPKIVAIEKLLSKPTSAGLFPKGSLKNELSIPSVVSMIDEVIEKFDPTILLLLGTTVAQRHQVSRDNPKTGSYKTTSRLILVVDLVFNSLLSIIFTPLTEAMKFRMLNHPCTTLYSTPSEMQRQVSNMRYLAKKNKHSLVNIDFSKYDTSIPACLKLVFFIIAYPYAAVQSSQLGGIAKFSIIYWSVAIVSTFNPVYYNGNSPYITNGSTVSGEFITSLVNTTIHQFVLEYHQVLEGIESTENDKIPTTLIQGDDGLYISEMINFDMFKETCDTLGLTLSEDTTFFGPTSKRVFFLGRYWNQFSQPYQLKSWWRSHSVYIGSSTQKVRTSSLATLRNYGLAMPYYNRKDMIDYYSTIDPNIAMDIREFHKDYSYTVEVLDTYDSSLFTMQYNELYAQDWMIQLYSDRYYPVS